MKVINSKLAAIGLAAFVFASCSDSSSDPTDGTSPKVDVAETITANLTSSSAAELAARVSNYKNTTANARSSSSQEQLRQEHLLLPIKLSFLLFLIMQDSGALQKT